MCPTCGPVVRSDPSSQANHLGDVKSIPVQFTLSDESIRLGELCSLVNALDGPFDYVGRRKRYKSHASTDYLVVRQSILDLLGSALPRLHMTHSVLLNESLLLKELGNFLTKSHKEKSTFVWTRRGEKRKILLDSYKYRYESLMEKARHSGLRARRVLMNLIDCVNKVLPFFHQTDLQTVAWIRCLDAFERQYTLFWFLGLATPWMKFHLAYFFSRAMGQSEHPKFPFGYSESSPLTGVGYVWWMQFKNSILRGMSTDPERFAGLANTVLQFKKALPAVHPFELLKATRDLPSVLGKHMPPPDSQMMEHGDRTVLNSDGWFSLSYEQKRGVLCQQVLRTTYELFQGEKLSGRFRIPSTSAHLDLADAIDPEPGVAPSVPNGGAYGYIKKELFCSCTPVSLESPVYEDLPCRCFTCTSTVIEGINVWAGCSLDCDLGCCDSGWSPFIHFYDSSQNEHLHVDLIYDVFDAQWELVRRCRSQLLASKYAIDGKDVRKTFDRKGLLETWMGGKLDLTRLSKSDANCVLVGNNVSPVALPEPLKTRMITKGPVYRYWVGSVIQKTVHSILRNKTNFVAIGRPLVDADLDLLGPCGLDEMYISGDYKAATDLLDPLLSQMAVTAICDCLGLGEFLSQLFREGLVGSSIFSEDGLKPQCWGQLMGSPLSFPVLCIVNAALNRFFLELVDGCVVDTVRSKGSDLPLGWSRVRRMLHQCPMLINGDDIVMRCRSDSYDLWKDLVHSGGLVPSIGKNYVSRDFCVINSTVYVARDTLFGHQFNRSYYINMGLIHPQFQRGGIEKSFSMDPSVWDLGAISHEVCRGLSPIYHDMLLSKYLGDPVVGRLLQDVPESVSFFVSKSLGGLGIKATRPGLLTPQQRGFYNRVALTSGELAPSVEVTRFAGLPLESFWRMIPCERVAEYWDLDQVDGCPLDSRLSWSVYLGATCEEIMDTVPFISEFRSREKNQVGWVGTQPCTSDLFYEIRGGYTDFNLCNFPWSRRTISVYPDSSRLIDLHSDSLLDLDVDYDKGILDVEEDLDVDCSLLCMSDTSYPDCVGVHSSDVSLVPADRIEQSITVL